MTPSRFDLCRHRLHSPAGRDLRADPQPPSAGALRAALGGTGRRDLVLAVWRDALNVLASTVGIAYPPSALFLIAALFILVVLLHYSTVISELSERNLMLAQRIALLEQKLKETGARDADTS